MKSRSSSSARTAASAPLVIWRDSKEFREVVFPSIAEALAQAGIRTIGEKPFRAGFNLDGVAGDSSSRWDCLDFVYFAPQVPVDDAGNMAPHVVCVDVWVRICRERAEREGWKSEATYRDAAISGASVILRPGIQALLEGARGGRFDVVVADALDRVSRGQAHVALLYKQLCFAGVTLVTLAEGEVNELDASRAR